MSKLRLVTLSPQPAPATEGNELPKRLKVLAWGENKTSKGPVIVNATTLSKLPDFQQEQNWDRLALDFEHNSVPGSPTYKGEPVKLAGYGVLELAANEGAFLNMTSWTADGKTMAAGGHYGDLSATVILNDKNEVIGIHSVALCRHGAAPGMTFLSADWPLKGDEHPPQSAEEFMVALKQMLGAPSDATPMQVSELLLSKLTTMPQDPNSKDKTGDKAVTLETLSTQLTDLVGGVKTEVKTLSDALTGLRTEIDGLKKLNDEREREVILSAALAEGKKVPEKLAKELPLEQLKALCAELPVSVPMDLRTPAKTVTLTSPVMDEISTQCGVTADDMKKYGGA